MTVEYIREGGVHDVQEEGDSDDYTSDVASLNLNATQGVTSILKKSFLGHQWFYLAEPHGRKILIDHSNPHHRNCDGGKGEACAKNR